MRIRSRAFAGIGRISKFLPAFRGRTRIFLELYRVLGVGSESVFINTKLINPVAYRAELFLNSWLQRVAFLTGGYEPELPKFLLDLWTIQGKKGYVLDIGANVGLITIPLAIGMRALAPNNSSVTVIAVEAIPDNVLALARNLRLNDLETVVAVMEMGLGDEAGDFEAHVEGDLLPGQGTGTSSILPVRSKYQCARTPVRVCTLDGEWAGSRLSKDCSIIKLDTDGYDLKILKGAREFLSNSRPIIFAELAAQCLAWHGQTIGDAIAFANELGYSTYARVGADFRFTDKFDEDAFVRDALLVPVEKRDVTSRYIEST